MKLALVIDRDRESVNLVKAILERGDFAVSAAGSTREAINMINAVRPHIILCDIAAPVTDALTFIAELRNSRNARLSKIPVIATTVSYEDPDHLPKIVALLLAASMSSAPPST